MKEQAEAAAQLLGLPFTEFVEIALEEKARNTIAQNERILVSERAFEAFVAVISTPPDKSSDKLLAEVAAYHEHSPVTRRS